MARTQTKALTGRAARGGEQLTITEFVEDLARKAEVHDPMRPATRLFLVVLALMGIGFLVQISHAATTRSAAEFTAEVRSQAGFRLAAVLVLIFAFRVGPARVRRFVPHLVVPADTR